MSFMHNTDDYQKRRPAQAAVFGLGGIMARPWAQSFYNSKRWQHTRDAYRKAVGGICEDCWERGILTPGAEVHHIEPLTPDNINDPAIALSWDNLRFLCKDCHAARHKDGDEAHKAGRRVDYSKPRKNRRYVIDNLTGNVTAIAPPTE